MNLTQSQALTVLLEKYAHTFADRFALQQRTAVKGQQVYLNTLAVYAVHSYLKWMEIRTDLEQGDSWNPAAQAVFNVADLVLPGVGKLECRPILPGEDYLTIPQEGIGDRIGYIAVRLGETLDQAELLGFLPSGAINRSIMQIPLRELQPLDNLIDTIEWHQRISSLWQTLTAVDWQPVEFSLRGSKAANVRSRSVQLGEVAPTKQSIERGKAFYLESNAGQDQAVRDQSDPNLLLAVRVSDRTVEDVDISLRLYPLEEPETLPQGLQVTVVDQEGTPCMNAQARESDDWIQLDFSCKPQEKFSIQMSLGEISITEEFTF
ncbi:MAG: DUF1822 family protein [Microcoleaceae cyanobacterium]